MTIIIVGIFGGKVILRTIYIHTDVFTYVLHMCISCIYVHTCIFFYKKKLLNVIVRIEKCKRFIGILCFVCILLDLFYDITFKCSFRVANKNCN